jgi:peptidoglycan/xylan/chitin deacetylase (PgdA/CDA1 family)
VRNRTTSLLALLTVSLGVAVAPTQAASAVATVSPGAAVQHSSAFAQVSGTLQVAAAKKKKKKTVALTFDDGPGLITWDVLDVLKKNKVPATFCIIGNRAHTAPKALKRIVAEGHQLCNHTQDHKTLTKLSKNQIRRQFADAQGQIKAVTGRAPKVVRFPEGAFNAKVLAVAKEQKLRSIGWTVDPKDYLKPSAKTIITRVMKSVKPGGIILLHDGGDPHHTLEALDALIKKLKAQGYTFVLA